MSRTTKEGKRGWRTIKSPPREANAKLGQTVNSRHSYGRTEKILRRNRKIWTRLLGKRRRRLDEQAIRAGLKGAT